MLHAIIGLGGGTLLLAAIVLSAVYARRWPLWVRMGLLVLVCAAAWFPWEGLEGDRLPGVEYLRALSGDISIVTLILAGLIVISQLANRDMLRVKSVTVLAALALTGGLFLYPMELGLTQYSPYTLGYGSNGFFAVLLALTLVSWYFSHYLLVVCLGGGCFAFQLDLLESYNLWDYLIDPVLVLFSIVFLIVRGILLLLRRHKPAEERASIPLQQRVVIQFDEGSRSTSV